MTNVDAALNLVKPGMKLGLGSGAASERFLRGLGERVQAGLQIVGVPTSLKIDAMARSLGIPVVDLDAAIPLDLAVDGADEVDPDLNMIKGYGRALLREKVVALAARQFVILIGPERVAEKRVELLGSRGRVPVEVVPFATALVRHMLSEVDFETEQVMDGDAPALTDNGNHLLHVLVEGLEHPADFDLFLKGIPGVVETGLFLDMADAVFIETDGHVDQLRRA